MLGRRSFVQGALLGMGAALLPALWSWPLRLPELPTTSEDIVLVDGWVLLVGDLAAVLG
jgi:hypothetical protein